MDEQSEGDGGEVGGGSGNGMLKRMCVSTKRQKDTEQMHYPMGQYGR